MLVTFQSVSRDTRRALKVVRGWKPSPKTVRVQNAPKFEIWRVNLGNLSVALGNAWSSRNFIYKISNPPPDFSSTSPITRAKKASPYSEILPIGTFSSAFSSRTSHGQESPCISSNSAFRRPSSWLVLPLLRWFLLAMRESKLVPAWGLKSKILHAILGRFWVSNWTHCLQLLRFTNYIFQPAYSMAVS